MVSWASVTAKERDCAPVAVTEDLSGKRLSVIDANAIISLGACLASIEGVLITTEEVLAEVRDSASRAALAQLHVLCREPSDASLRIVSAFARKTGDLHQLSLEDLRLLALVYTLEDQVHGTEHLREAPPPVKAHSKQTVTGVLPGWGNNGASEDWDALDDVPDPGAPSTPSVGGSGPVALPAAGVARVAADGGGDGEGWEDVRVSKNAARRAKRKAFKRAERHQMVGSLRAVAAPASCSDDDGHAATAAQQAAALAHFSGDGVPVHSTMDIAAPCEAESKATDSTAERCAAAEASDLLQGESSAEAEADSADGSAASDTDSADGDAWHTSEDGFDSTVSILTADFPMQNVALQMGLRVSSRSGRRVHSLERFVMRCDGCSTVTKTTSKVFCPACGHATLSRVVVTVGADGVEQYGVRKKHILRGTRFTLPKPRGGRNAANPILSEDVYNKRVRKPRKKAVTNGDDPLEGAGFGELKKHANQPSHVAQGLSYLTTNWRNNPNERKDMARSNRRR